MKSNADKSVRLKEAIDVLGRKISTTMTPQMAARCVHTVRRGIFAYT